MTQTVIYKDYKYYLYNGLYRVEHDALIREPKFQTPFECEEYIDEQVDDYREKLFARKCNVDSTRDFLYHCKEHSWGVVNKGVLNHRGYRQFLSKPKKETESFIYYVVIPGHILLVPHSIYKNYKPTHKGKDIASFIYEQGLGNRNILSIHRKHTKIVEGIVEKHNLTSWSCFQFDFTKYLSEFFK